MNIMVKLKRFILPYGLLVLFSLLGFQLPTFAEQLPNQPNTFYLDQLGVLTTETKELIQQKDTLYKAKTQAPQVVLAVVESTDGDSIDNYAADLFKKWKIGNQKEDNGILIVYALNDGDRNVRIEVGYGLEDVITDSLAGNILQHAKDDLKSTDSAAVNKGLQSIFNAVTTLIDEHYYYPKNEHALSSDELKEATSDDSGGIGDVFEIFFVGAIVLIVIFSGLGRGGRGGRGGGPWYWGGGYGGGGGGGSSSGGGGGGGFSGGGGSSGGGGASI